MTLELIDPANSRVTKQANVVAGKYQSMNIAVKQYSSNLEIYPPILPADRFV